MRGHDNQVEGIVQCRREGLARHVLVPLPLRSEERGVQAGHRKGPSLLWKGGVRAGRKPSAACGCACAGAGWRQECR